VKIPLKPVTSSLEPVVTGLQGKVIPE
jgi:hypothetical protein